MKKYLLVLTLALLVVLAACGDDSADKKVSSKEGSKETVTMKIGSVDPRDVAMGKAMEKFKELVEEKSDGTIKVEVFLDSQLGGERDIIEGVQLGTIQGGPIGAAVMANFEDTFNLWSLPFVFPTREDSHRILDGDLGRKTLDNLESHGLYGLGFWESGIRNLTNDKGEIKTPEDLKGLKIRTLENDIQLDLWKELGASPTGISFAELFSSLQQGVVDGQENPYSVIAAMRFFEVQSYVTQTEHVIGVNPFILNKDWFDGLSEEHQNIIKEAEEEARQFQRDEKAKEDEAFKNELIEEGMTITELTEEERAQWIEKAKPVIEKYREAIGAELVDQLLEEAGH